MVVGVQPSNPEPPARNPNPQPFNQSNLAVPRQITAHQPAPGADVAWPPWMAHNQHPSTGPRTGGPGACGLVAHIHRQKRVGSAVASTRGFATKVRAGCRIFISLRASALLGSGRLFGPLSFGFDCDDVTQVFVTRVRSRQCGVRHFN